MRIHGTLIKWNDDRGFGFIKPAKGDSEVFVHISAFAREGGRPLVGELISFEIENGKDGRQRAVRVMRPGQRPVAKQAPRSGGHQLRRIWRNVVLSGAVVASIVGYFTSHHANGISSAPGGVSNALVEQEEDQASFHCDGRTMCSQMTSCREATYFINNCPGTKMDGDRDGVPCERQWCD